MGQPSYAAYNLTRGSSVATDATLKPDARRAGLAVEQAARGHSDADSLVLLGKTHLLLGEVDQAIEMFAKAGVDGRPDRLNDLGAAYIQRGSETDNKDDLHRGLEFVDKAIAAGARGSEVRFNRALALEKLAQTSAAIEAWREYISIETNAQWRREGEEHLQRMSSGRVSERLDIGRAPNGSRHSS